MSDSSRRSLALQVISPWFFLNLLVTFVLTLWMPLARITKRIEGEGLPEGGQILQEATLPVYRVYQDLFRDPAAWSSWQFVALHIGVVVFITYLVWYVVLALGARRSSAEGA